MENKKGDGYLKMFIWFVILFAGGFLAVYKFNLPQFWVWLFCGTVYIALAWREAK